MERVEGLYMTWPGCAAKFYPLFIYHKPRDTLFNPVLLLKRLRYVPIGFSAYDKIDTDVHVSYVGISISGPRLRAIRPIDFPQPCNLSARELAGWHSLGDQSDHQLRS